MIFERRLRSYSIDTSFAFIIMVLIGILVFEVDSTSDTWKYALIIIAYLMVYIIPNLISPGQTFGKRTQKMKVVYNFEGLVSSSYVVPSRFVLVLREVLKAGLTFISAGFYLIIAGIISTNREDGRTIHDFIFKTRVIALTRFSDERNERFVSSEMKNNLKGSSFHD
jgi:uncharacterized RDD family membrane protein YckC